MDVLFGGIGMETLFFHDLAQSGITTRVPLPEGVNVKTVLSAAAELTVTEVLCGAGQATVTGELTMNFLLEEPSGECSGFTARSAFRQSVDVPGAEESMKAEAFGQILEVDCEPDGDAVKAELVTELNLFIRTPGSARLVTELRAPGAETRYEQLTVRRRCALGETNLRIRDEVPAMDARRVLISRGAARVHTVQFSGTTANVEGDLYVTVLTERDGGELSAVTQVLPFRDSFTAAPADNCVCRAFVRSITADAADASFGVIDIEAVIGMELIGVEQTDPRVLADAYDPAGTFTCERTALEQASCLGLSESLVRITENLAVPKHLPEVRTPCCLTVIPSVTGTDEIGGRLNVDAMLLVTAVYRCEGGFLHSFTEDVPVRFTLEAAPAPLVSARVSVLSATLTGTGRLLEMGLSFSVLAERYEPERVMAVTEVLSGGAKPTEHGIIIYCADAGETLWDVGKRFLVPVEELRRLNENLPDEFGEGRQILLMR